MCGLKPVPYLTFFVFIKDHVIKTWLTGVPNRAGYDIDRVMVDVRRACVEKGIPRISGPFCDTVPHILIVFML